MDPSFIDLQNTAGILLRFVIRSPKTPFLTTAPHSGVPLLQKHSIVSSARGRTEHAPKLPQDYPRTAKPMELGIALFLA
jgi:hypothetical protein